MSAPWHLTAAEMDAVWDELVARLAEATELLARAEDDLSEWERIHGSDPQTTRLRLEITGFMAADSAKPVCEACGGAGKAYLLHSRAERPCPMCQADQPPVMHDCGKPLKLGQHGECVWCGYMPDRNYPDDSTPDKSS